MPILRYVNGNSIGVKLLKQYGLTKKDEEFVDVLCKEAISIYSFTMMRSGEVGMANFIWKLGRKSKQFFGIAPSENNRTETDENAQIGFTVLMALRQECMWLNLRLKQGSCIKASNGRTDVQWFVDMDVQLDKCLLLNSIYEEPPRPMRSFKNNNGEDLVPAYGSLSDDYALDDFLTGDFVKAVNKLQSVALSVNGTGLDALLTTIETEPVEPTDYLSPSEVISEETKDTFVRTNEFNKQCADSKDYDSSFGIYTSNKRASHVALSLTNKIFYQRWFLDWRGRCNVAHPHYSYQNHDSIRSTYNFADGQVLNQAGLRELKIHVANSFGQDYDIGELPDWMEEDYSSSNQMNISVDKLSFTDRVRWTDENMGLIQSVSDGKILHEDAEKPHAFLVACVELTSALNDENHICHLPIPIDATASAYQHYGAMSKDKSLCELVGLTPTAYPNDVYSIISQRMSMDNKVSDMGLTIAEIRKTSAKPSFMTFGYSAGAATISKAIFEKLSKNGMCIRLGLTKTDARILEAAAATARNEVCDAEKVRNLLVECVQVEIGSGEYFYPCGSSAQKDKNKLKRLKGKHRDPEVSEEYKQSTMGELQDLQKLLETTEWRLTFGNGSKEMEWVSPSGFPVYFRKYKKDPHTVQCQHGGERFHLAYTVESTIPMRSRYESGIAPNYIHSQDAALVHLVCAEWDKPILTIHDSFSCLPNEVSELRRLLQSKMHELYNFENPLELVVSELLTGNTELITSDLTVGDWDVEDLFDSLYSFS